MKEITPKLAGLVADWCEATGRKLTRDDARGSSRWPRGIAEGLYSLRVCDYPAVSASLLREFLAANPQIRTQEYEVWDDRTGEFARLGLA